MRQFELLFSENADLTLLEWISVVPKKEGMRYFQAHPIRNDGEDFFFFSISIHSLAFPCFEMQFG